MAKEIELDAVGHHFIDFKTYLTFHWVCTVVL